MSNGKWLYEKENAEIWYLNDEYDTKDEAIAAGREFFKEEKNNGEYEDYDHFEVGQKIIPSISGINVDWLLDNIGEHMYDEVGEVAQDFLADVQNQHKNILEERLYDVINRWMDEFNYNPTFFKIEDTSKVQIEE